ncbi:hypothetical protein [Hymenobacter metallicola]|uniref:Outer membrane protein beta-barrel domain-containing protein n=1 Tax=Hymenobacter metallicola TaxID=2563114 RepID=A0A4Z0QEX4_9BACT|nr:hypothetical protein [Hymenobacter metallicola]TGE28305.1 hypothetical protein E5K02_02235 [Hymenobacter metallicola]
MSKVLWSALLLSAGVLPSAHAQVSKFSGYYGTGVVLVRSTGPEVAETYVVTSGAQNETYDLKTVNSTALHISGGISFDTPLYKFSPDQSVGISLNASAGILGAPEDIDGFNTRLLLDFPEYLTWRYGAKASRKTKKTFGIGAGLGYRFSYFFVPFHSPSAMLEGVYAGTRADWFLRLSGDLRPTRFYNMYSSEGPVEVLSLRELHVVVGRSF